MPKCVFRKPFEMRAVALVGILVAFSLAGCVEPEPLAETDSTGTQFDSIEVSTEMPERRFEPQVILDTKELEVEQASNPELEFYVTDMKDYPFPVTFIDWALFHDRNPNPVAEGDATDLPGTFNQTLFAQGYHMFGFRVDDTQVLNETRILILEVGEHEDEYPTEYQIAHFRWRIDKFFNDAGVEPLPPAGEEVVGIVEELVPQRHMAYWRTDNSYCEEVGTSNVQTLNAVWLDIDAATWGQYFFTDFSDTSGLLVAGMRWNTPAGPIYQYDTDGGEYYEIDGFVPEGATRVYFFSCGGVPGTMSAFYKTGIPDGGDEFPDDPGCKTDTGAVFTGFNTIGGYITTSGGTWGYQETNGISGLQRGGSDIGTGGSIGSEDQCANHDTIIF